MVKLVLYDRRPDSPTCGEISEFFIGEHRPLLVHIPREVAHGFTVVGMGEAIIVNLVTEPYDWSRKDG